MDILMQVGVVLDMDGRLQKRAVDIEAMQKLGVRDVKIVASGYGYYDVWRSNLQKCIRRGLLDGAIRSLYEMWGCNNSCRSNAINRICKVIVSEDIGCANPYLAVLCNDYLTNHTGDFHKLCKLVHIMCDSKKSRLCDDAIHAERDGGGSTAARGLRRPPRPPHQPTPVARGVGGTEHCSPFAQIARHIGDVLNKKVVESGSTDIVINEIKYRKRAPIYAIWRRLLERAKPSKRLYKCVVALFHIYEKHHGEGAVLNVVHAAFLNHMATDAPHIINDDILKDSEKWCKEFIYRERYEMNPEVWPLDCAYDKHTKVGANLGRGLEHFIKEGSIINKKAEWCPEIEMNLPQMRN